MGRRERGRKVDGWIVLDKPVGMTSTEAVARVKRIFDAQKAGHAGTLDPLASGCLPIALGEATKTVSFVMDGRKVYRFTVRWGAETETDDTEGAVCATSDVRPDPAAIGAVLPEFTGRIMQVPPRYSAVKIAGERAYDLARDGETVSLDAREIVVHRLDLVECPNADTAVFLAECGKGTYVRALARDMGRRLGTRGHVVGLRRLVVGPFDESHMISLEMLEELRHNPAGPGGLSAARALRSVETALDGIPALKMTDLDAARLRRGQAVILRGRDAPVMSGPAYAIAGGIPVALGEVEKGAFNPKRVFNLAGQP
ncbi:tRNA pseudouridine(55) synthase TruB [Propylenella binzhouense]|uniref:tRNA pseudouridine synthase B n=1 Tax=Propylenella binzhouense TaxID=2555902 RepID=A0A964T4Z4_9HYPH|nr:tRNA pseudouridine(55) synthase TruB [Propylenella binzhouense]MYZ48017.1 tRNA pseudouridine(55) synthase TruB [Propylenella binzhouense]